MGKLDFKKELKDLYTGKVGEMKVVTVPKLKYLMFDGQGDPNTSKDFANAFGVLYPVAYTLKFMCKALGKDYSVMPPEGTYWAEDMTDFLTQKKGNWHWTLMMVQPDFVTDEMFHEAVEQVRTKKNPPALGRLRYSTLDEGRAAQVMYMGPYDQEGPTIDALHEFIRKQGGTLAGQKKHHEIYMSDMRRTAPEKLKTIIRQPF